MNDFRVSLLGQLMYRLFIGERPVRIRSFSADSETNYAVVCRESIRVVSQHFFTPIFDLVAFSLSSP